MTTQRYLGVVLALVAISHAEDDLKQLDPERVRTLLIAGAERQSRVSLQLEFRQKVVWLPTPTGRKQEFAVHVKLSGRLGGGSSYQHVSGARPTVSIMHRDQRYEASRLPNKTWVSSTTKRGTVRISGVGLVRPLRFPVRDKVTWAEFLRKHPILEASKRGDELTVFFPLDSVIARLMRKRKLNGFAGLVGWRCVLQESGKRFRLQRIEHITTTYKLVADPAGGAKREPHTRFLTKQGRRSIIGSKEFGLIRYTEFSGFKAIDGIDLPMKVVEAGKHGVLTAEIDPLSLKENVTFTDSDFAFRPPRSFGDRGMHTDTKKGTTKYYGHFDGGRDGLVLGLAEGARRLGAQEPAPDGRALWWALGAVGMATGLALLLLGRGRPKPQYD